MARADAVPFADARDGVGATDPNDSDSILWWEPQPFAGGRPVDTFFE